MSNQSRARGSRSRPAGARTGATAPSLRACLIGLVGLVALAGAMPGAIGPARAAPQPSAMAVANANFSVQTRRDVRPPDIALLSMSRRASTLRKELDAGEPVIVNFVFTTCSTICSAQTATLAALQRQLRTGSRPARFLTFTIDPDNDTPEQLARFARQFEVSAGWDFFTGAFDDLVRQQEAFDVYRGAKAGHPPVVLMRRSTYEPLGQGRRPSQPAGAAAGVRTVAAVMTAARARAAGLAVDRVRGLRGCRRRMQTRAGACAAWGRRSMKARCPASPIGCGMRSTPRCACRPRRRRAQAATAPSGLGSFEGALAVPPIAGTCCSSPMTPRPRTATPGSRRCVCGRRTPKRRCSNCCATAAAPDGMAISPVMPRYELVGRRSGRAGAAPAQPEQRSRAGRERRDGDLCHRHDARGGRRPGGRTAGHVEPLLRAQEREYARRNGAPQIGVAQRADDVPAPSHLAVAALGAAGSARHLGRRSWTRCTLANRCLQCCPAWVNRPGSRCTPSARHSACRACCPAWRCRRRTRISTAFT